MTEYWITLYGIRQEANSSDEFTYRSQLGKMNNGPTRHFVDEKEMLSVMNPILKSQLDPSGDIQHAMHFIQREEGWGKNLLLTDQQAASLGAGRK